MGYFCLLHTTPIHKVSEYRVNTKRDLSSGIVHTIYDDQEPPLRGKKL